MNSFLYSEKVGRGVGSGLEFHLRAEIVDYSIQSYGDFMKQKLEARANKYKFGARAAKHKFGDRAGKHKFEARAVKYKLGAKAGK